MKAFGEKIGEKYMSLSELKDRIRASRLQAKDIEQLYESATGDHIKLG